MVLAIWVAALVEHLIGHLSNGAVLWTFAILLGCGLLAMVIRIVRGGSLADLGPGWVLSAWFLVRFAAIPATFLLALFWLVASVIGLEAAGTLGEATLLTLLFAAAMIMLTSAMVDLAAAIKGPGQSPPSDG